MKAAVIRETGGPEVFGIDEVDAPVPGPRQVRIQVAAAGVNFADVMMRQGVYLTRDTVPRMPAILGTEVAGIVLEVGEGVDASLVGRRVVSFVAAGYAEQAVAPVELVTDVPDGIELTDAVAMLVQGVTARHLVREVGGLRPGQTVLIHAAAGGVGSLAVQLAVADGGRVIATAGTEAKRRLAGSLGADVVLDYAQAGWPQKVVAATDGRGADLVLDAVGGDIGELSLECLAPFGRLVVYGVASGQLAAFAGSQLMQQNQAVLGYWLTSRLQADPQGISAVVGELLQEVSRGAVRPIVDRVMPLEEVAAAHEALSNRSTSGKVVLTP